MDNGRTRQFTGDAGATTQFAIQDAGATTQLDAYDAGPKSLSTYRSPVPDRLRVILPDQSEQVVYNLYPHVIIGRRTSTTQEVDIDLGAFDNGVFGISRLHAIIEPSSSGLSIKDLKSVNGTQVNGQRLSPADSCDLHTGDRIKVGNLRLEVHFEFDEA